MAEKVANFRHFGSRPPAAQVAGTPRGAGISGKKKGSENFRALVCGGPKEDRTPDLCIANAALSQLSYRPETAHDNRAYEQAAFAGF